MEITAVGRLMANSINGIAYSPTQNADEPMSLPAQFPLNEGPPLRPRHGEEFLTFFVAQTLDDGSRFGTRTAVPLTLTAAAGSARRLPAALTGALTSALADALRPAAGISFRQFGPNEGAFFRSAHGKELPALLIAQGSDDRPGLRVAAAGTAAAGSARRLPAALASSLTGARTGHLAVRRRHFVPPIWPE